MKTDELLDRFTKSLENMSDEDFANFLNEIESAPQEEGITVGEFFDTIHRKSSIDEIINFDCKNQVKSSVINDFLNKESLIKEVIKINQSKVSYFSSNTMQEIDVKNENLLNAA
jgi:hypothetical protein